ncbi:uncharacterized protein SCDLUD_004538 [Saccharomycodes ludwigii]|uniref:uncharacterized protein n=1 Tax=Saccharomycodes ludwigii TaxID=36035 RepID=UPI001E874C35|nr:hypothetical protein SCDLUD_004538 [Saccharomycodes ludwigii]KAH3899112.1 hypothetical protein SCDLUD_004538 [Saccharomycodes ludwigii]
MVGLNLGILNDKEIEEQVKTLLYDYKNSPLYNSKRCKNGNDGSKFGTIIPVEKSCNDMNNTIFNFEMSEVILANPQFNIKYWINLFDNIIFFNDNNDNNAYKDGSIYYQSNYFVTNTPIFTNSATGCGDDSNTGNGIISKEKLNFLYSNKFLLDPSPVNQNSFISDNKVQDIPYGNTNIENKQTKLLEYFLRKEGVILDEEGNGNNNNNKQKALLMQDYILQIMCNFKNIGEVIASLTD